MNTKLWVVVLIVLTPRLAPAALIFSPDVTDMITLTGSFHPMNELADLNFRHVTNSGTIEFGAEGELQAFLTGTSNMVRAGSITYVVSRNFQITEDTQTLVHVLRAEGTWTDLLTLDAEGAFYSLEATYTDEILEGIVVRNILRDAETIEERTRNKQNEDNPISFRKGPARIRLPVGNYTLRSTFNLFAQYRDADWQLDLFDGVIGPQGIGSVEADKQGFESQVGPRDQIPEPSTMALLAIGVGGVVGQAWKRRRPTWTNRVG